MIKIVRYNLLEYFNNVVINDQLGLLTKILDNIDDNKNKVLSVWEFYLSFAKTAMA